MGRVSNGIITGLNVLTLILAFSCLGFSLYFHFQTGSTPCQTVIKTPLLAMGVALAVVSLLGLVGACYRVSFIMWIYLFLLFILIIGLMAFTVFTIVVTNRGIGRAISGIGAGTLSLGDYSTWLQRYVVNTENWNQVKSCFGDVKMCQSIAGGQDQNYYKYNLSPVKEMIFRGTDTVAILLEWILARLILHTEIQAKAQDEIDNVIGINRTVSDSDLPNLPYLQAIVKETLRVHPPGPLLSWARLAIHDTHVGPHFIPAGTTAMVNMWAITHDDKVWAEPEKFIPERFLEQDVAIMGSDLRLAPFGSGRRVCPGKTMGLATAQLWLAQLLQNFKWSGCDERGVDLSECLKLSMEMKKPLVCKALPRMS